MIKIIGIGSLERISEFNDLTPYSGKQKLNWMNFGDPTMADYFYAPYIEWEVVDWESKGYEFVQFIDSQRMVVKKTNQ